LLNNLKMKRSNYKIIFANLALLLMLVLPNLTLAVTYGTLNDAPKLTNNFATNVGYQPDKAQPLPVVIGKIVETVMSFLGVVFFVLIVFGGWKWLVAGGNDEEIGKAKSLIRNAIIGLVIVFSAYLISRFVVSAALRSVSG